MELAAGHIIGILLTIGLLLIVSVWSGRKVKNARGFIAGGRSGRWMVCGIVMGTLVGGQSTIGTAQLAFCFGLSAWWFTIGASLGCLFLGLFYVVPLRRSGCVTLAEIVAREYGHKAEAIGSVLCMGGIFISIVSQVLASSAMITSMFGMGTTLAALLSAALIVVFVLFGGIRSAGSGGLLKTALLYVSSLSAAYIVWRLSGGLDGVSQSVRDMMRQPAMAEMHAMADDEAIRQQFGNLLARGPLKDLGSGLSLLLGVLSTQSYAQGVWAARNHHEARRGVLLSALLVPVIGAACTLVGLYARGHYLTAEEANLLTQAGATAADGIGVLTSTAEVFPRFILDCCPPWLGGIVIGTLFVTVLGGGSGLALGATTIIVYNVVRNLGERGRLAAQNMNTYRICIVLIVAAAMAVALASHRTLINDLGFLSLGLRATALLLPLSCALFLPGRLPRISAIWAMIAGTLTMLAAFVLALPSDPIFWGIGAEAIICLITLRHGKKARQPK